MALTRDTITDVIRFCNRDLVPSNDFDSKDQYHNEWFISYFSFLGEPHAEEQLGDAFYQARFMYKLMNALRLPLAKQKGIVKFQIVQYASICEAVLDLAIEKYFNNDARDAFSEKEYVKVSDALSSETKITYRSNTLILCKEKRRHVALKYVRVDKKTKYAVSKGLITEGTKQDYDRLYELRNNVHILKAADSKYEPKLREAKEAFFLMQKLVGEVKHFYQSHDDANSN